MTAKRAVAHESPHVDHATLLCSFKKKFGHSMGTESVSATGGVPPIFMFPPTPKVVNVQSCIEANFTVNAVGINPEDFISITPVGKLPVGATLGNLTSQWSNPATVEVYYTARPHQTGVRLFCFSASNSNGLKSQKCVRVIVHPKPPGLKCPPVPITSPPTATPTWHYNLATIPGQVTTIGGGGGGSRGVEQAHATASLPAIPPLPPMIGGASSIPPPPPPPNPELAEQAAEIKSLKEEVDVMRKVQAAQLAARAQSSRAAQAPRASLPTAARPARSEGATVQLIRPAPSLPVLPPPPLLADVSLSLHIRRGQREGRRPSAAAGAYALPVLAVPADDARGDTSDSVGPAGPADSIDERDAADDSDDAARPVMPD